MEAFQYSAPFDRSMMVVFRKRLPESVVNDCNERIVLVAAVKQQFIDDQRQRNAAEGKIGQGKPRYGRALILFFTWARFLRTPRVPF
jgi:hypothetical protein